MILDISTRFLFGSQITQMKKSVHFCDICEKKSGRTEIKDGAEFETCKDQQIFCGYLPETLKKYKICASLALPKIISPRSFPRNPYFAA